jgi:hypothetical protein
MNKKLNKAADIYVKNSANGMAIEKMAFLAGAQFVLDSYKTKIIELSYMVGGESLTMKDGVCVGEPTKSIETQMEEILKKNKNYKFVSLVYRPSKITNMEYATLVVEYI